MNNESRPIDLALLKKLIAEGVQAIQSGAKDHQAIMFIGDTGVGKSTLMSFLSGCELIVKFDGLKTYLDSVGLTLTKIGHQKYSQTTIPTKVSINGMACYDCPGFKDNKGEEFQIANSFFIQRLFDIYGKIKIVIVVDESHISEARVDKLPRMIKSMHESFGSLNDMKEGCCIIVNKADPDAEEADYEEQLKNLIHLQNSEGHLFDKEERDFLKCILDMKRLMIFRRVRRQFENKLYVPGQYQQKISHCIETMHFASSKHIHNIISESAKLAIHDFIDEIQMQSAKKIQIICSLMVDIYNEQIQLLGQNVDGVIAIKEQLEQLIQEIRDSSQQNIIHILQKQLNHSDLLDFQRDFASVMFFKNIYDKTSVYFNNLVTKIESEISFLTGIVDQRIVSLQKELKLAQEEQRLKLEQKMKQQRKQEMRIRIMQLSGGLDDIILETDRECTKKLSKIGELKNKKKQVSQFLQKLAEAKIQLSELSLMKKKLQQEYNETERKAIAIGS